MLDKILLWRKLEWYFSIFPQLQVQRLAPSTTMEILGHPAHSLVTIPSEVSWILIKISTFLNYQDLAWYYFSSEQPLPVKELY
jgi:hypothetical protein